MEKLLKWVSEFNDSKTAGFKLGSDDISQLMGQYHNHLHNSYVDKANPKDKTNNPLRPSSLGKPALLIAHNYYYPKPNNPLPAKNGRLASIGYYFELWLTAQLLGLGYEVSVDHSRTIRWHDQEIECHADLIIDQSVIVECKEVKDWYFKQWMKYNKASDDRGYITQAALYSYAYKLPVIWIMGNRTTGELDYKVLDSEHDYITRAYKIIDILINKTKCWEDCFQFMSPEPPNKTKHGLTVPYTMYEIADKVYELDANGFVIDYKYPPQYAHLKPELV